VEATELWRLQGGYKTLGIFSNAPRSPVEPSKKALASQKKPYEEMRSSLKISSIIHSHKNIV
jgi:hypothetical protein